MCPQAGGSALIVARLCAGTIDVAFIYLPIDSCETLAIDVLAEEPFVAVLPVGHPLAGSRSLHLRALADEKFVMFSRELNPVSHDAVISGIESAGLTPKFGQQASLSIAAVPMVAAGLGWSVVPQSIGRILPDDVAYVPIDDVMPKSKIALAHRRDDRSTAVQNFVAWARRQARIKPAAKKVLVTA
jgi:DNA-binding transcriptional LysR family regulator